jgi:hypothetical protein
MINIPEEYHGAIVDLCRRYNVVKRTTGVAIDPASIDMDTDLKNDIGLRRIDMLQMEVVLERSYPAIEGVSHTPGINTVGDVIRYVEGKTKAATSF